MYTQEDIPSLAGKQFTVPSSYWEDIEDFLYTIGTFIDENVLITWKEEQQEEYTTYTKEEVVDFLNNKIWIIAE